MYHLLQLREVLQPTGTANPTSSPDKSFKYVEVAAVDNQSKTIVGAREVLGGNAPSRARKVIRGGDILVSTVRPGLNAVAIVPAELDGQIASTGFAVLRPTNRVLSEYVFFFVRSRGFVRNLSSLVTGAMYPAVTDRQVLDQWLPVPDIVEQRRVVDILARAEGIVRLRQDAQKKGAEIIPALFLDMFGDPATNPKRWPTVPLGEVLMSIDSGHSPKCHDRPRNMDEWGVLRLGAVTMCEYKEEEHKTLPSDVEPDRSIEVRAGDLLVSRKNTLELVGAAAYVWSTSGRMLLPDLIFRLNIADQNRLHPIYLWQVLMTASERMSLRRLATGSAGSMPNISKERLRTLMIPVPIRDLQINFAELVGQVRSIQLQQATSLSKAGGAFDALLSNVFSQDAAQESREAMSIAEWGAMT